MQFWHREGFHTNFTCLFLACDVQGFPYYLPARLLQDTGFSALPLFSEKIRHRFSSFVFKGQP